MLSLKLYLSCIYLTLIVSLYYCCCASQLISTAIISPSLVESGHTLDNFGAINTAAGNLFSHYSMPQNSGPTIIASMSSEEVPNFFKETYGKKLLSRPNSDQKPNYSKLSESPTAHRISSVPQKYNGKFGGSDYEISSRITERPVRVTTIKHISQSNASPRLIKSIPVSSKSTTSQPLYSTYRVEKTTKPTTNIQPKYQFYTTSTKKPISTPVNIYNAKVTKQPQTTQQPLHQQHVQQQQPIHQHVQQQQHLQQQQHQQLEQQQKTHENFNQQQTQEQYLQKQNLQQQSTKVSANSQSQQQQQLQHELQEQQPRQQIPKHIFESNKKEREQISTDGSEDSYQLDFYNQPKIYQSSQQIGDQINSYTPVRDESLENPDSYQNYANLEPEPQLSSLYEENFRQITQSQNTEDKNSIKLLLEQFVRQLDILKSVAEKELYKSNIETNTNNDYIFKDNSKENNDFMVPNVAQPLVSNNGAAYHEYQNERSVEQTSAVDLTKTYRDTNEKNGRYGTTVKPLPFPSSNSVSNYLLNTYLSSMNSYPKSELSYRKTCQNVCD